jgi:diamine N-acetyltransferase
MRPEARPFAGDCFDLPSSRLIRLQPQHADAIAEQLAGMDPWLTLGYSPPTLHAYLMRDDPALHRYALEYSGDLAGLFCVRHPWLFGPHLELLAIFPDYQGHGIGRDILDWVGNQAHPWARNLWVLASSFNAGARRFYRRHGFIEITSLADLVQPGSDEFLLRKVLR